MALDNQYEPQEGIHRALDRRQVREVELEEDECVFSGDLLQLGDRSVRLCFTARGDIYLRSVRKELLSRTRAMRYQYAPRDRTRRRCTRLGCLLSDANVGACDDGDLACERKRHYMMWSVKCRKGMGVCRPV